MTARRSRGDGGLYWDEAPQRWIAAAGVGYTAAGRRVRQGASGRTKTEAKAKLKEIIREYEDGVAVATARTYSVGQAVDDWLEHGLCGRDPSTVETLRILAREHVIPALGARRLVELSAEDVDAWLAVQHFRGQRDRQRAARALDGRPWVDNALVFASEAGTDLDAANVRRGFRRVADAAGLDAATWTPRELRHSSSRCCPTTACPWSRSRDSSAMPAARRSPRPSTASSCGRSSTTGHRDEPHVPRPGGQALSWAVSCSAERTRAWSRTPLGAPDQAV